MLQSARSVLALEERLVVSMFPIVDVGWVGK